MCMCVGSAASRHARLTSNGAVPPAVLHSVGEGGLIGGDAGAAGDLGHVLGHAAADCCFYTYRLVPGHAQGAREAHGGK